MTPRAQALIDDFAFLDDWEDRYRHVMALGDALSDITPSERTASNKIPGCASQVWLVVDKDQNGLALRGDSDSRLVKGLVAVLAEIYSGLSPKDAVDMDAHDVFKTIGLSDQLTSQRANGLASMIDRIRTMAGQAAHTP